MRAGDARGSSKQYRFARARGACASDPTKVWRRLRGPVSQVPVFLRMPEGGLVMRPRVVALLIALGAAGLGLAYDPIRVWYAEPNDPNAYVVRQDLKTVTIYTRAAAR